MSKWVKGDDKRDTAGYRETWYWDAPWWLGIVRLDDVDQWHAIVVAKKGSDGHCKLPLEDKTEAAAKAAVESFLERVGDDKGD